MATANRVRFVKCDPLTSSSDAFEVTLLLLLPPTRVFLVQPRDQGFRSEPKLDGLYADPSYDSHFLLARLDRLLP